MQLSPDSLIPLLRTWERKKKTKRVVHHLIHISASISFFHLSSLLDRHRACKLTSFCSRRSFTLHLLFTSTPLIIIHCQIFQSGLVFSNLAFPNETLKHCPIEFYNSSFLVS